jgi:hypothetical protein
MILMRANQIWGPLEGVGPENQDFLGPESLYFFGPRKSILFWAMKWQQAKPTPSKAWVMDLPYKKQVHW